MSPKRFFDITVSGLLLILLILPIAFIYILIILTSSMPAIYWSRRVGKNNKIFKMPKFRTMRNITPEMPTDELEGRQKWLTPLGLILRKTSIDELPQLWSVFIGDMSLIGPRPSLHNQHDLIQLRTQLGIQKIRPGITGWAQINGRDNITLEEKVKFDEYYLKNYSFKLDLKILLLTIYKIFILEGAY